MDRLIDSTRKLIFKGWTLRIGDDLDGGRGSGSVPPPPVSIDSLSSEPVILNV